MGFGRRNYTPPVRVARVYKGKCGICYQDIIAGQAYDVMDGSNTSNQRLVHYNCYKPTNAPTWEELKEVRNIQQRKGR